MLAVALSVFSANPLHSQYNAANLSLKEEAAVEQYSFDKLRIYPITANRVFLEAHKSIGTYKPLKEGLADGTVKVIERGAISEMATEEAAITPVMALVVPSVDNVSSEMILSVPPAQPADTSYRNNDGQVQRYVQAQQLLSSNPVPAVVDEQVRQVEVNEPSLREIRPITEEMVLEEEYSEEANYGASDEVNRLFIQNTSDDSLFIMAGEVVKGGKQDRVIAMDMVIPPHSAPVDMSVYCVEHGRWTYGGDADASDGFTEQAEVANTSVRKAAIVNKDQSEVWSKVEEVTTANDAATETGTLNALLVNPEYQKELQEYVTKFGNLPSEMPQVIGVVAVTGDRVIGCDMFATPDLFRNAYTDLLKSYASEAITSGSKVKITNAAVDKYISNILDESNQKERVEENGQMYRRGVRTMHISTF